MCVYHRQKHKSWDRKYIGNYEKNEIWSFKNLDEYFDPKFGLVYKDFGNNAFEIILCSTDYDHLSMEDIIIPTEHLIYSILLLYIQI